MMKIKTCCIALVLLLLLSSGLVVSAAEKTYLNTETNYKALIMDDNDLAKVCAAAPEAVVIASHMDNVPHATLTRRTLSKKLKKKGIRDRVRIPEDGECYTI